jgi:hypothetical protein
METNRRLLMTDEHEVFRKLSKKQGKTLSKKEFVAELKRLGFRVENGYVYGISLKGQPKKP